MPPEWPRLPMTSSPWTRHETLPRGILTAFFGLGEPNWSWLTGSIPIQQKSTNEGAPTFGNFSKPASWYGNPTPCLACIANGGRPMNKPVSSRWPRSTNTTVGLIKKHELTKPVKENDRVRGDRNARLAIRTRPPVFSAYVPIRELAHGRHGHGAGLFGSPRTMAWSIQSGACVMTRPLKQ